MFQQGKIIVWAFRISTSKVNYLLSSSRYGAIKISVFLVRKNKSDQFWNFEIEAPGSPLEIRSSVIIVKGLPFVIGYVLFPISKCCP